MNKLPLLFAASLAINLIVILFFAPPFLVYDEGSYSLMLLELSRNPAQIIPTITGEAAEYKPPLFTWALLPFFYLLKLLPLSIETVLRLPSALFGALSVSLIFLITKKLYGENAALFASLLFMSSPALLFTSSLVIMESFSILLILAAVYFYIEEKLELGALFLGLLVLTKWLYVISPLLFVTLFFLHKPKFPKVLASYLAIPLFIVLYFVLAFFFGSPENAAHTFLFDIARSQPQLDPAIFGGYLLLLLWYTFPISPLFIFLLFSERRMLWKEKHLVAMALVIFPALLSEKFLLWYASISFPAMIVFVALSISRSGKLAYFLLAAVLFMNLFSLLMFPLKDQNPGTRPIAEFAKGKNVTFLETRMLFWCWDAINERYKDTDKAYLLLEQNNPGLLYYRFNDSADYENLHALFSDYNETPGCGDYLVVDGEASVPDCYHSLWNISNYRVYSTKE